MAYTITTDISRMIVAGQKEVFMGNFKTIELEYPSFVREVKGNLKTE